ncbi:MAG TPA: hypothetical protein VHD34_01195, partial [Xanthobacteraceae bacterium]|nr:hypothetical protein [Xanthobacteraceae bacterium]
IRPLTESVRLSKNSVSERWFSERAKKIFNSIAGLLAFSAVAFGIRYANQYSRESEIGLKGATRSAFVEAAIATCSKKQNEASENIGIAAEFLTKYCACYANRLADSLSISDLKKTNDENELKKILRPKIDPASASCQEEIQREILAK